MQTTTCNITNCFLCQCSSQAWKKAIIVNKTTLTFKKGESIFAEGGTVTGIYFIFKGSVKVYKQWGEGKELILRFAKQGDVLGHRGIGGKELYPVSATALEYTTACFIDNLFLEDCIQTNPILTYKLMQLYATELQKAEKRMTNLAHMSVKGRIAEAILELRSFFGVTKQGNINVALTRQDISSFVGTTYETIFKIFVEWTNEKIISTDGKQITILNEVTLKGFIV